MAKLNNQEIATLLREYAGRSALRGDNPYRWKAYARAADSLPDNAGILGGAALRSLAFGAAAVGLQVFSTIDGT